MNFHEGETIASCEWRRNSVRRSLASAGVGITGSPPPGGGRSARASGPGGGDGRAAKSGMAVLAAAPPPHPGLPSAVRPSPFRGGYTTRLVGLRRRLASLLLEHDLV